MGFYRTARHAGAEKYGEARAERYGRQALWGRVIGFAALAAFLAYCYVIGH
jgi:uncharacterized membrane protein